MMSLPGRFCHVRSQDMFSSHVTATSCMLQPCRNSNVPKTWLRGLLHLLPGDFQSNDVTSESLPVRSGHVTGFSLTRLPPAAGFSPVGVQTHPSWFIGLVQQLTGYLQSMTSLMVMRSR